MTIKLLNNTQKEQLIKIIGYYNFFYICNDCGNVYGSDKKEFGRLCPECQTEVKIKPKKE